MAHTISYNDVTATGKTQQYSYVLTAEPSLYTGHYDLLRLSLEVLISGTNETDLYTQYTTLIDAWKPYNAKLIYSVGGSEVFSFKNTGGVRNVDVGFVKPSFGKPRMDHAGACLKFDVVFEYTLTGSGSFSPRRGSYNETWSYDSQGRATVRYMRRERWDRDTYPTRARDQAIAWIEANYTFPDSVAVTPPATAATSSWVLGAIDAQEERILDPDGTEVSSATFVWLTYNWSASEKHIPYPDKPAGTNSILDILKVTVTTRLGEGTALGPVYVRTVEGSATIKKASRSAVQTQADANEMLAKWEPAIRAQLINTYLADQRWVLLRQINLSWDVTDRVIRFSLEGQAKTEVNTEFGQQAPSVTRRGGVSFAMASRVIDLEVSVSSNRVRPVTIHERYSGERVAEATRRPFTQIRISGRLTIMIPPGSLDDLKIVEPAEEYYYHSTVRCVSFTSSPALGHYLAGGVYTARTSFESVWELHDESVALPWKPFTLAGTNIDLLPPVLGQEWPAAVGGNG